MGIGNVMNSTAGKIAKWTVLGAAAISSIGIGQQGLRYHHSVNPDADSYTVIQTKVDKPQITRERLQQLGITKGSKDAGFTWRKQGGLPDTKLPGPARLKVIANGVRENLENSIQSINQKVEMEIEAPTTVEGSLLGGVRAPLPTGDKPLFSVSVPKMLSGDFYKAPSRGENWKTFNPTGASLGSMKEELLPVRVRYSLDHASPKVTIHSETVNPKNTPRPPDDKHEYAFLAGIRTTVHPENRTQNMAGSINLNLDTDGRYTQQKIEQLHNAIDSGKMSRFEIMEAGRQARALKQRLSEASGLHKRIKNAGFEDTLRKMMDNQDYNVKVELEMQENSTLAEATHYFWLGPDRTGDGNPDVYVTQEVDLSGIEYVTVKDVEVQEPGTRKEEGIIGRINNKMLQGKVGAAVKDALTSMQDQVKEGIYYSARDNIESRAPGFENTVNKKMQEFFQYKS